MFDRKGVYRIRMLFTVTELEGSVCQSLGRMQFIERNMYVARWLGGTQAVPSKSLYCSKQTRSAFTPNLRLSITLDYLQVPNLLSNLTGVSDKGFTSHF